MNYLERAIQIAVRGHSGQVDRSGHPYILHPLRVMHKVGKHRDDMISAAAVLHDVIEDCGPEYEDEIREEMPPRVYLLVQRLTHRKDVVSYREYIESIAPDPQAKIIKLADLTDNLFHPARRDGWKGHEKGKQKYLASYFYLTSGDPWPKDLK